MLLTQCIQIRGLTTQQYVILRTQCRLAKNMFNVGLYSVRQFFLQENRFLPYEANYHHCKENENYKLLHSQVAQQCLKSVDEAIAGFFKLLGMKKGGSLSIKVNLPHYLPKDGYFPLVYPQPYLKDGAVQFSVSNEFKKAYRTEYGEVFKPFKFSIPPFLRDKKIKEFRIIPKHHARYFVAQFVYEVEEEKVEGLESNQCLSLDLGLNNLIAAIDTNGSSFLVDGRKLKSINQWYNKQLARLQSIKNKQGIKNWTNRLARITLKRNYQVDDYIKKTARIVIDRCLSRRLGTLIVGVNVGMKQEINLGKTTNQNFVAIPLYALRKHLEFLCLRYGITYLEQEESYTSQASAYDLDPLPQYNADNPQTYTFSGRRIKRGLYQSKEKKIVNADLVGAMNIGRKCKAELFEDRKVLAGILEYPLRVFIT